MGQREKHVKADQQENNIAGAKAEKSNSERQNEEKVGV